MTDRARAERPKAADVQEGRNAGDNAMEDDLTEERDATPEEREDVAEQETVDP